MKNILFCCLLILAKPAISQNPYYDAITLSKFIVNGSFSVDTADQKIYCGILNNYLLVPFKKFNASTIAGEYTDKSSVNYNPFLEKYFPVNGMGASLLPFNKSLSATVASVGGLNVTNFADGLAKFLVKRFKEELSISFFEKFSNQIADTNYQDMQLLFTQTHKVLQVSGKDIFNFSSYINTLREAFIKDLGNLYVSFKKVKALPKYEAYFNSHPAINSIAKNAFYFIDQFTNAVHPGDMIANFNADEMIHFSPANASMEFNSRSAIKTLQLFSKSLKSVNANNYWVPADSVGMLLSNNITRDIYFGLIYQQAQNNLQFKTKTDTISLQQILQKSITSTEVLDQLKLKIENIASHTQEVNETLLLIKEQKKAEIDFNDYYKLFNAALDILDEGFTFIKLPSINLDESVKTGIEKNSTQLINISRDAAGLFVDIRTKNYASAILNTISLIDAIFDTTYQPKLRSAILKYGNFAANIAAASNSDEVERAIESVALPAGNSRVKRESNFNISLNAYVGGIGGWEYLPALKQKQTSSAVGFAAPVGIAFSIGGLHKKDSTKNMGSKSLTLFVSMIDVGSLASFRLQNDSSKVASEIQLKNIIAPGLFLYYGLGKCPISIGAGVQIGPQLREVTAQNINIEKNYYLRYGLSICVDIPLLNFYTKSN